MKIATRHRKYLTLGEVLPNGARVIDYQVDNLDETDDMMPGGTVLAMWPSSPDPYVTWTYGYSTEQDEIFCFNGHYFDRLQQAVSDFEKRAR